MSRNKHIGRSLSSFFEETGKLQRVHTLAAKKIVADREGRRYTGDGTEPLTPDEAAVFRELEEFAAKEILADKIREGGR